MCSDKMHEASFYSSDRAWMLMLQHQIAVVPFLMLSPLTPGTTISFSTFLVAVFTLSLLRFGC